MTAERTDVVFDRVRTCMGNLVGGSGHLTSYRLERETFEITATRELDDGNTEYAFAVEGTSISEFTGVAGADANEPWEAFEGSERLEGTVVLDADGNLVLDDAGRVRIEPWRTLDPSFWPRDDRERIDGGDDG